MPAQASKQAAIEPLDPKSAVLEMTQVVENKKRNLEKRKQKLDVLMAKPEAELTEQQKEAVSHMGEVNGNIMYVGEILQRFREIQAQVDKWIAIEAKKEKQANIKRNKQNAGQSATSDSTSQRTEPVINGHATSNGNGNEASADITPRSRGSICDPSGTNEQPIVAEPGQAADARDSASDLIAPLASVVIVNKTALAAEEQPEQLQAPSEAAAPIDDAAPNDDEGVPLKETVTFVNSGAESAEQPANSMQPVRGRSAPRRGNRGFYDGPPRDGYGPRYGRPPRRGGPYRGPRGGPHAPPSNRPPVAASAGAAN